MGFDVLLLFPVLPAAVGWTVTCAIALGLGAWCQLRWGVAASVYYWICIAVIMVLAGIWHTFDPQPWGRIVGVLVPANVIGTAAVAAQFGLDLHLRDWRLAVAVAVLGSLAMVQGVVGWGLQVGWGSAGIGWAILAVGNMAPWYLLHRNPQWQRLWAETIGREVDRLDRWDARLEST